MPKHPLQALVAMARDLMQLTPETMSLVDAGLQARGIDLRSQAIHRFWFFSLREWYRAGANVFSLTDSLVAAFILTTVKGNSWPSDIALPFDSFFVHIPEGYARINNDRWVRYMAVTAVEGAVVVFVTSSLSLAPEQRDEDYSADLVITMPITEGPIDMARTPTGFQVDDVDLPSSVGTEAVARRVVLNFCSWLHSLHDDHPTRRACQAAARRRGPVERPEVIVAGQDVKLSADMRAAARDLGAAAQRRSSPGWKLRFKHVVRGHWRHQPVGTGRAERRLTWIAPYWKGPEGAAAWSHIYKDSD